MIVDPFAQSTFRQSRGGEDAPPNGRETTGNEPRAAMSLFELNSRVRAMLHHTMADCYWIAAEISELRMASNGHCYLEFVQKDADSGSLVAKARATIWRSTYTMISTYFERQTGMALAAGMKVMVNVSIAFHELFGYSLNVVDIDPTYTLGDMARRRQEIIRRLEDDGVINLNKELTLLRVISRVAVISSKTAAGYGDFCKQLEQSGYHFNVRLFPATMQGENVESSIIEALSNVYNDIDNWDVAVIIRGGGATADLSGFDAYYLACFVAEFPIPVLTGIGHERDDTILDLVAHKRLKTPTAVAAFLIDTRKNESGRLDNLASRLAAAASQAIQEKQTQLALKEQQLTHYAELYIRERRYTFDTLAQQFQRLSSQHISKQHSEVLRLTTRLQMLAQRQLLANRQELQLYPRRIRLAAEAFFSKARHKHDMLERSVKLAQPSRILALGFSITMKDGKPVRNADELSPGDEITTLLQNGEVRSTVK